MSRWLIAGVNDITYRDEIDSLGINYNTIDDTNIDPNTGFDVPNDENEYPMFWIKKEDKDTVLKIINDNGYSNFVDIKSLPDSIQSDSSDALGVYVSEFIDSDLDNHETLNELLKLEIEMKKYTPVDCSYLEELISPTYVKEIVDLLDEVKSKLD